jgi:hypothetical protein
MDAAFRERVGTMPRDEGEALRGVEAVCLVLLPEVAVGCSSTPGGGRFPT